MDSLRAISRSISPLLSLALLLTGLVLPSHAQRRAIVVSAEQPNVWTLEQAHYLLAQMHRRNLDLKATGLGELDPNEINGLHFDVLKTLLEFGVAFDDAARFNNSLLKTRKTFDADRALRLQKRRDQLADESLALTRDLGRLERELALAKTQEEKENLAAAIKEKTVVKEGIDEEVTRLDNDLKTAGGPSGDLKATEAEANFDPSKMPKTAFDDTFKEVTKKLIERFNEAPKLNASLRLDNFLQMQYEIISKQLTLLRDEVGPGQRIIFLEMPQSVNATYDKANKKWAQSWWKIVGYTAQVLKPNLPRLSISNTTVKPVVDVNAIFTVKLLSASTKTVKVNFATDPGTATPGEDYLPQTGTLTFAPGETTHNVTVPVRAMIRDHDETFSVNLSNPVDASLSNAEAIGTIQNTTPTQRRLGEQNTRTGEQDDEMRKQQSRQVPTSNTYVEGGRSIEVVSQTAVGKGGVVEKYEFRETAPTRGTRQIVDDAMLAIKGKDTAAVSFQKLDAEAAEANDILLPENPAVRTIELIPRQSSLNVNDIKIRARSGVLTAVAKTLFGFGARLNYQRQRETFSQFVQQELYSSGFGKGSREFGWTFTPMPGTDRVLSGVRTTYAVLVVPEEAETLVVETTGCVFPRAEYQPTSFSNTAEPQWRGSTSPSLGCTPHRSFVVPIPGGGASANNEFWVNSLEYVPVKKGERAVLSISGKNFSSQVGVMIDGVPLTQAIGLAQPFVRDDSLAGQAATQDLKDLNIRGRIERVDSNQIIAVFERLDGKEGTPVITLTSPGKAKNLNRLSLRVNSVLNTTLEESPWIFGTKQGEKAKFRIDGVEVFRSKSDGKLMAVVTGAGFKNNADSSVLSRILVNGDFPTRYWLDSPTLLRAEFPVLSDETIQVTLVSPDPDPSETPNPDPTTIVSDSIANPARLRVTDVSVVAYEAATDEEPGTLIVKIEGSGFSDDLRAYLNKVAAENALVVAVKSATEAILKITDPEAAAVVILKDIRTGVETKTIVTRRSESPK